MDGWMDALSTLSLFCIHRSGVKLHPVQPRSEIASSLSGRDLPGSESTLRLRRRSSPFASPTRRLRFEDETETDVEFRYLERQRRREGHQGTVLVSKPDVKLHINSRAGQHGARQIIDRQQRGWSLAEGTDQCDSSMTVLGGRYKQNPLLHPPVLEYKGQTSPRPYFNLRTEPIKETYIGPVTPGENGGGRDQHTTNNPAKTMNSQAQLNNKQANRLAPVITDLPINPYAADHQTASIQHAHLAPSISKCPSALSPPPPSATTSHSIRYSYIKVGKTVNPDLEEFGRPATVETYKDPQSWAEMKEMSVCLGQGGLDPQVKNASFSSSSSVITGNNLTSSELICFLWKEPSLSVYQQHLEIFILLDASVFAKNPITSPPSQNYSC